MYKNYSQKNKSAINKYIATPSIGVIAFFSEHKVAANLLMMLMILFGIFGLSQLKRQLMPDFGIEKIMVSVEWPGASAEDIEENIINAIEPEVRFINDVDDVDSIAYEGRGQIYIGFETGSSMSKALTDIQSAVARISTFPQDIEKPVISEIVPKDEVCTIDISGPFSNKTLKYFARQIRDDLIKAGLASVEFEGARDKEIWIEVPTDNLRELDLSLEDISNRLAASSIDLPSGSINSGGASRQIRSEQLARSPNELRKLEVLSLSTGEKLYLKDIATVYETFQEDSTYRINSNGPSIGLAVYRTKGADSIISQQRVEEYMKTVSAKYPKSLDIIVYDKFADTVRQRIDMLIDNGATGLLLVLIVLFFFLNGRIALWVAVGIPVAFLAALGAMNAIGLSLDMISMFALIMGIGIVVDDAIVVSEHTTTLHRRGMNYKEASRIGAQRMFPPVLAACLTTVAAFLPVLMVGAEVGEIIATVPITLSLIIIASLIECFLILPMHLRHSMKKISQMEQTKIRKFDIYFNKFRDEYVIPLVERTYASKRFTVVATVCLFLISISFLFSGRVNFEFFDTPESDVIHANFSFSPGTPQSTTELMVEELGRAARAAEIMLTNSSGSVIKYGVGDIGTFASAGSSIASNTTGGHIGSYTLELVASDIRNIRNIEFLKAWEEESVLMPGVESFVLFESAVGGPPGRDIDVRIAGDDLQAIKIAALALRNEMRVLPGLIAVEDDMPFGKQEILLEITPEGEAIGFTAENIARQVRNAFSGSIAQRFSQDTEEVIVRVKLPTNETKDQSIRDIYLISPNGNNVLLSEVVVLKQRLGFTKIRKEAGVRKVSITADIDPSITTTNQVIQSIRKNIAPKIEKEFNVVIEYKGKAEEQSEALGDLSLALIITLSSIYIILAWLFSSYTTPFLIMAVIPFGLIGAILGHYILGFNLSMFSLLAFFGLTGVLVNDSIILVRTIKEFLVDGYNLSQSIIEGVRERLRPIVLTTITTIVGLTPILFEQSLQARLVQPLAVTFIFGMLFVPYLVLIFIPSMMGIAEGLKSRIKNAANFLGFYKGQYE
tara:strand:- start:1997 stop:5194 length:3198 start_codon:yes stop_codon:yes gene_type:complete